MSSVDSRIVTMKFDNKQFQQGAGETLSALDRLKSSLDLSGAVKGVAEFAETTGSIEGSVTKINTAFFALSAAANAAITKITQKMMTLGGHLVANLGGINAIRDGFTDYELKVGSVRTLIAGTGESLKTVNKNFKEMDGYADQTIYSLTDMTNNITKFTNAGVKLPVAVAAMKGIGNAAALAGVTTEGAASAMYNFGQAMGEGYVDLQNWSSIDLSGMGTVQFKQQLIDSAVAMGTLNKNGKGVITTSEGNRVTAQNFTKALKDQWLTTDVLNKTLGKYADETTALGKKAYAAATEVSKFSDMMTTLASSAGTGWTDTFEIIIGNLPEATKLWSGMTATIGGFIGASSDARNAVLADWKELGGRKDLIKGLGNVFKALFSILEPIGNAFKEIFPPTTGKQLAELTENFRNFTKHLKISEETADNIKNTFKGVFAVFSIAKQVISSVIGFIFDLVGALGTGTGGLLAVTGGVGNFIAGIDEVLKKGDLLNLFFDKISFVLIPIIKNISELSNSLVGLFTGGDTPFLDDLATKFSALRPIIEAIQIGVGQLVSFVKERLGALGKLLGMDTGRVDPGAGIKDSLVGVPPIMEKIREAWAKVVKGFNDLKAKFAPMINGFKSVLAIINKKISEFFEGLGFEEAVALIDTTFFIMLYRTLKQFIDKLDGVIDGVTGVLGQLTDTLKTMQAKVRADIIFKIAIALGILAVAVLVLAQVDAVALAKSLSAIAVMLGTLVVALAVLEKKFDEVSGPGAAKLVILSGALIGLSIALVALSVAVGILGSMDVDTLAKGIISVAVILAGLTKVSDQLTNTNGSGELIKISFAILVLSFALTAFAIALRQYSEIDLKTMTDGGLKMVAVLWALSKLMSKMPTNMLSNAAALVVVSASLLLLARALEQFGAFSAEEMAKSLTTLAISLGIMSGELRAMSQTGPQGAIALLILSVALNLLVPPLARIGELDWKVIAAALTFLVAIFIALGVSAHFLTPVAPTLFLIAQSVALLGRSMLFAGAGMFLFAAAMVAIASAGAAGTAVMVGLVLGLAGTIPLVMQQVALGIVAFAKVIGDGGPIIVTALSKLFVALLQKMNEIVPLLPPVILKVIRAMLKIITEAAPDYIQAAINLLLAFLAGIEESMDKVTGKATDVIVAMIKAFGKNGAKIARAGMEALTSFLNGLAEAIDDNADEMRAAGKRVAFAIADGLTGGLFSKIREVRDRAWDLGKSAINAIRGAVGMNSPSKEAHKVGAAIDDGLSLGMLAYSHRVEKASETVGTSAISSMRESLTGLADVMTGDMQLVPVITPVLDLSQFRRDSLDMAKAFGAVPITTGLSFDRASSILNDKDAKTSNFSDPATPGKVITFEQNNYSPKPLSPIDIYRQTKNQLSMAKGALI